MRFNRIGKGYGLPPYVGTLASYAERLERGHSLLNAMMNAPSFDEFQGETEFHSRCVTLSDGNTYSVELEMTLEHR